MKSTTLQAAQDDLTGLMDAVCTTHRAVMLTRDGLPPVVMLSLSEWESLADQAYLSRNPGHAHRLLAAMAELNAGFGPPAPH